jgi:hypothetical protein
VLKLLINQSQLALAAPLSCNFVPLFRPVRGLSGGLCGLASLYQALENTILTVSQLTQFTYVDMRAAIAEEMGTNSSSTSTLTDSALLDQYYACKKK